MLIRKISFACENGELYKVCACYAKVLNRHQVFFFGSQHFIDIGNVFVGQFLHGFFGAACLVFGDFLVFKQFFHMVVGIAAHIADGNAAVFGFAAHDFNQVFAALFGEHGHGDAD